MTMKTEDQARECWCPFAEIERCIASDCMAWRWGKRIVEEGDKSIFATGPTSFRTKRSDKGYYGLAGKP